MQRTRWFAVPDTVKPPKIAGEALSGWCSSAVAISSKSALSSVAPDSRPNPARTPTRMAALAPSPRAAGISLEMATSIPKCGRRTVLKNSEAVSSIIAVAHALSVAEISETIRTPAFFDLRISSSQYRLTANPSVSKPEPRLEVEAGTLTVTNWFRMASRLPGGDSLDSQKNSWNTLRR